MDLWLNRNGRATGRKVSLALSTIHIVKCVFVWSVLYELSFATYPKARAKTAHFRCIFTNCYCTIWSNQQVSLCATFEPNSNWQNIETSSERETCLWVMSDELWRSLSIKRKFRITRGPTTNLLVRFLFRGALFTLCWRSAIIRMKQAHCWNLQANCYLLPRLKLSLPQFAWLQLSALSCCNDRYCTTLKLPASGEHIIYIVYKFNAVIDSAARTKWAREDPSNDARLIEFCLVTHFVRWKTSTRYLNEPAGFFSPPQSRKKSPSQADQENWASSRLGSKTMVFESSRFCQLNSAA